MKAKEMVGGASRLTWAAVAEAVSEHAPHGMTNYELAEQFGSEYDRVSSLTKIMYESGALSRVQMGRTAGTTMYFDPI